MPFASVKLLPGVNVERTATLLEAGYSQSNLIRYRNGLAEKLGGWTKFYNFPVAGVPRAVHAWEDLNQVAHLGVGTTTQLGVITSGVLKDITPQTLLSDFSPNFTTTANSTTILVEDSNINNVTVYDAIFFNVPISIGGIILSGLYPITVIASADSYEITAAQPAVSSQSNTGTVPQFTTTTNSATVEVVIPDHGLAINSVIVFPIATTVGGVTIIGQYNVVGVADADTFTITTSIQATSSTTVDMNGGDAELLYYIALGPSPAGVGYGLGGYGAGGYGSGTVPDAQTGDDITATDWTLDNWGEIVLGCPRGGGVYFWSANGGFQTAELVATGPIFNGGLFVSMPEQILVLWGSTIDQDIGVAQDPLLVRWSDALDFTNYVVTSTTQAGSYHIPTGSLIVGGVQGPQQGLIWTDIDLWAMSYLGPPLVFGFNKVSGGSGLIAAHAMAQLSGVVYWMGRTNFYEYGPNGAGVIPCSVWDAVFQNLNTSFLSNCWAWANTPFNEIWFYYPSAVSAGQCDSYVKYNTVEQVWDYGTLSRSCGINQSVLGMPIAASPQSIVYQHETTNDADGQPMAPSFTTGYFELGEGEDLVYVDWLLPDMKWGDFGGTQNASIQLTLNVINFPGDTPRTFGPYTVSRTTQAVNTNFRGRQASYTVQSNDIASFWRLGRIRHRFAPNGRR